MSILRRACRTICGAVKTACREIEHGVSLSTHSMRRLSRWIWLSLMTVVAAAVLLFYAASFALRRTLAIGAGMNFMAFRDARARAESADAFIRVHVNAPVDPSAAPRMVVDIQAMSAPIEAAVAPAPRPEKSADANSEAESNSASHKKAGARRKEDDARIIVRHHDVSRINRIDGDIRSAADHDLLVAAQVSILLSLVAFACDGIHHVLLLRPGSVAQV